MTVDKGAHEHSTTQMSKDHLGGLRHGDLVNVEAGRLCVPVKEKSETQWSAVSKGSSLQVNARSSRGELAHNSRANEGFEFTVMDGSEPIANADVRVVARMPHHDKKMAGGHGPANDPDAQGMTTKVPG